MQTFLTYKDSYTESIQCLDYRRHGKQRIEAYDVYGIITRFVNTRHNSLQRSFLRKRYENHPVVRMWRAFPDSLAHYYNISISSWINRGYQNNMPEIYGHDIFTNKPDWLTDKFCNCHRSKLLFKGSVDGLVFSISSHYHSQYKNWKDYFGLKAKNKITYEQRNQLVNFCNEKKLEYKNHYEQFNWNVPDNLDYIWPV